MGRRATAVCITLQLLLEYSIFYRKRENHYNGNVAKRVDPPEGTHPKI